MLDINQETCCDIVHEDAVNECTVQLNEAVVESLSETFKALADPTRIRILYNLSKRELCVCDLAKVLGMTQSAVSHQLRYLKALRLVKNRRDGNTIYYRHDDAHTMGLLQMAIDHSSHVNDETGDKE
ncbi:metalloregulator ArsR/SmtB family transcription factor [Alicyclobacillus fastidiosus]|uniref:Metalloregulator ArsR/SmtB family transcription factor n=1 Tax=Alicyclobacillus fastidiosus TaxID=392011 RepID=A0ABY6ZJB4_9BACL|nr:metalloregulator ArsR/SmtB family transcription factor [Alicyclobacillus fastidiosus]WAH42678.1 metalloregulator ArsR/SmtB family transcription factor [Alicyclobacillus fastidiosus]GMA64562.1 transcription regulator ArsR [Alicyclobacillus fastidiosus]